MKRTSKLLFLSLIVTCYERFVQGASYVATVPSLFRPGEDLNVNINIFNNPTNPVNVKVRLLRNGVKSVEQTTTIPPGTLQTKDIILQVPHSQPADGLYEVSVVGSGGMTFTARRPIAYNKATVIHVQLDRGMYAKNEMVKSRVLVFHPSLKPYTGVITVEVFDAKDKQVRQWSGISGSQGVFIKEFSVGSDPELGTWKFRAYVKGQYTEKTFVVRKYVVPKFTVNVTCNPKTISTTTDSFTCTVTSRFTFGKDVNGTLRFQAVTEKDQFLKNTYSNILGTKSFTILLAGMNVDSNVEVIAQVGDTATGTTVTNAMTLTFNAQSTLSWTLEPNRGTFVAGLPFVTFVKFKHKKSTTVQMTVQMVRETIQPCPLASPPYQYRLESTSVTTHSVNVDANGYGRLSLSPGTNVKSIAIQTYSGTSKKEVKLTASGGLTQSIIIEPTSGFASVGSQLQFVLKSDGSINGHLAYQVFSRGYRVSRGDIPASNGRQQTVNIPVTPDFYPRATVVVLLSQPGGNVLIDKVVYTVIGKPMNNFVSLTSNPPEGEPGEEVSLTVGSMAQSTVYLLSVDEGVMAFQAGYDVTQDDVNRGVKESMAGKDSDVMFVSDRYSPLTSVVKASLPTVCKAREITKTVNVRKNFDFGRFSAPVVKKIGFPASSRNNALSRSIEVLSDVAVVQPAVLDPVVPRVVPKVEPKVTVEVSVDVDIVFPDRIKPKEQRIWFPKTWLWESVLIGNSNSTTIVRKLPDSVTTWVTSGFSTHSDGLGLLEDPLKTKVFQDFFLEVSVPDFIVVGSAMAVKVTIFNYTPLPKVIFVQMFFRDKQEGLTRNVPSGESVLVYMGFQIRPDEFGEHNVTVVARDLTQNFAEIDKVKKLIVVKPPGIDQSYNIPTLISLTADQLGISNSVSLTVPDNMVPGTKRIYVTVTGDILAPSIKGVDNLIRMPTGCGEQTMMYLAPNIYVLEYLIASNQITDSIKQNAIEKINKGKDRELTWRRPEGSFSVWGTRDASGSTWLTSFVLRCFHMARKYIPIDSKIFTEGIQWLISRQHSDGSFRDDRTVIHYHMQGGVRASTVTMTAYILLTFLENDDLPGLQAQVADVKNKAVNYLLANTNQLAGNHHGRALVAYALRKAGQNLKSEEVYQELVIDSLNNNGMMYWKEGCRGRCRRAVPGVPVWQSPNPRARPIDVETAAYALLYCKETSNVNDAMLIAKWLTSQRNPTGGFSSTQDTVVSLQGLAEFALLLRSGGPQTSNLTVRIRTPPVLHGELNIHAGNRKLVQTIDLPDDTDSVQVQAIGVGIAIVDVVVQYSIYTEDKDPTYLITTSVDPKRQTFDTITVRVCVNRKDNVDNGMAVVEVGVPSGFRGDVDKSGGNVQGLRHVEPDFDKVNFYFDRIGNSQICFSMTAGRLDKVTQSEPMPIYAYDYYEPVNQGLGNYTSGKLKEMTLCNVCKECSVCQDTLIG